MQFIRLIRPINLLVIILTMYGIRVFFIPYMSEDLLLKKAHPHEALDYFLLVFSTVLIAAGGNIINDYFDVKADRINKPNKVIIGKYIKPRWAIVSHWILNFIAFSIACYLTWAYETFWYVFIHLLSINILWFYSMYFKRKFLIGNILIAALTGLVPILCGIHFLGLTTPFHSANFLSDFAEDANWISRLNLKIFFVVALAFFATSLNLVREIIKDMEDVEGDLQLKAKTIPIVLGVNKTRWISFFCLLAIIAISLPFLIEGYAVFNETFLLVIGPCFIIYFFLLISCFILLTSTNRSSLKRIDIILKLTMLIGCCMPFYWYFL
ncbi:geranylgeranylglycerol-phosphate geranylgeranyltransferase [Fluviicola taffensis]|uniref:Geranylgeranyl glycerol-phosphate geranylgeranyltransferase n=1 Tax=Fluviicola taffensis (strain DSM 16823 / NCIMB 13979 / RW262) TaxID=755732 RepID=F2IH53_FLUTR|nr:geranylgeranylglycerol-phosphate geranylgeranyltransferase [Fluviicola taffensis]AEA45867.1 Geranylgeranyl glycerol-phosphate geranylgeranyltransferase [Fluviicola taffensis DSM 16823]